VRVFLAILLFLALGLSPLARTAESPALERARAEVERIRTLVDAGAMPKATLEKAELDLAEAQDETVLGETLYGRASVDDLTNDQAGEMMRAAQRQLERQQQRVDETNKLIDEGVEPRSSLTPLLEELDRRRRTVALAESRVRLLEELAKMAELESQDAELAPLPESDTRTMVRFNGNGAFSLNDYRRASSSFRKKFGYDLPVSAMGTTAVHRALGFDHSNRVDVAINPDQEEGRWLRAYLEQMNLPYYAFRAAIRGKATGAHIHMGPPSVRLRTVAAGKSTRTD
jgi:hypothetical protein